MAPQQSRLKVRAGTFERFANAAMVTYILLVPILICGGLGVQIDNFMGSTGGANSHSPPDTNYIGWFATHPFPKFNGAGNDGAENLGSFLNTCAWATVPACFAGSVAAGLHNGRGTRRPTG